jgi:hypothetical protein
MPIYNSITGQGTPPPPDDGSYAIVNVTETTPPELEAPDPETFWGVDGVDTRICREGDNVTYGGGGGYNPPPSNNASPEPTNGTDVVEPPPPETAHTAGLELSLTGQVFMGASIKAGILVDTNGQTGLSFSLGLRAGWAFGFSGDASAVVAPGQGVDQMSGVSLGGQLELGITSTGVSRNLGNSGPEGPPTFTVSPPGAGIGVMVGATSELELTGVIQGGPRTPEETEAMFRAIP